MVKNNCRCKDGPGNHASGAAHKPTPANRGAIPATHRNGNEQFAFIPNYDESSHHRTGCTKIAILPANNVNLGWFAALSNASESRMELAPKRHKRPKDFFRSHPFRTFCASWRPIPSACLARNSWEPPQTLAVTSPEPPRSTWQRQLFFTISDN